jgi:ribonuclease-3
VAFRDPLGPAFERNRQRVPLIGPAPEWDCGIGHRFAEPALLRQALTHRSASRGSGGSNERLEFLGDRVLGLLIAEWLAALYPAEREGDLGKRLAVLVARPTLADIAVRIGLAAHLIMPDSESRAGVRARATVMADAVEAVIAALYLDGGLDAARRFVRAHFAAAVAGQEAPPMPAKTRLQEWLAARALPPPVYRVIDAAGPSHAPRFTVLAEAHGRHAEAAAGTKRVAEEAAAARLLALLQVPA